MSSDSSQPRLLEARQVHDEFGQGVVNDASPDGKQIRVKGKAHGQYVCSRVTPMPWSTRPLTIVAGCPVGYCKSFCGKTTPRNILVHVCLPDPCLSPVLDWLSSAGCVSKTLPCGLLRGFVPTTSKITKMSVQLTITVKYSLRIVLTAVLHPASVDL